MIHLLWPSRIVECGDTQVPDVKFPVQVIVLLLRVAKLAGVGAFRDGHFNCVLHALLVIVTGQQLRFRR